MPLVEIENLTKSYRKGGQEVPVLRDLAWPSRPASSSP